MGDVGVDEVHLLPADARCLACRYSLAALTELRCPECGRVFDPEDISSYHTRSRSARLIVHRRVEMSPALLVLYSFAALAVIDWLSGGGPWWMGAAAGMAMIGIALKGTRLIDRSEERSWGRVLVREWLPVAVSALALAVMLNHESIERWRAGQTAPTISDKAIWALQQRTPPAVVDYWFVRRTPWELDFGLRVFAGAREVWVAESYWPFDGTWRRRIGWSFYVRDSVP